MINISQDIIKIENYMAKIGVLPGTLGFLLPFLDKKRGLGEF